MNNGNTAPVASPVDIFWTPWASYSLLSETKCAMKASVALALSFTFNDSICNLFGTGQSPSSSKSRYFSRITYPSSADLEEVARIKQTYSTTEFDANHARRYGVDDDENTYYASIYNPTGKSWWIVDIGEMRTIYQIHILPRPHAPERFRNVELRIGNELITNGNLTSYTLIHFYEGPYAIAEGRFICTFFKGAEG
ncbi:hypothetical protein SK128_017764, partial [Halocaridina rubra]